MPTTPRARAVVSEPPLPSSSFVADASTLAPLSLSPLASALSSCECSAGLPVAPFATSFSTGAGCSGSSPPGLDGSIQRTTSSSEYVCSALKTSSSASVGSWPTDSGNCWNWPGSILPPLQVTLLTASSIVLPCICSGLSSLVFSTFTSQPGTACGITEASGCLGSRASSTFTVEALSFSLGTLTAMVL